MRVAVLLAVVIASGVLYHLAQKSAGTASPWPMLSIAYGTAFAVSLVLAAGELPDTRTSMSGVLLGLSAFGIEAGFFYLYRTGSPIASTSVIASVSVTAILVLVGVLVFGERLTLMRGTGLALAAGAAVLMVRG